MPIGVIVLLAVSALIFLGFAQRVLDRMQLTDIQAIIFIIAMVAGSFINIPLSGGGKYSLNVGGAVLPVALAIYVLAKSDSGKEVGRALLSSAVIAGALYIVVKTFTFEEGQTFLDPLYLYAIGAGIIAYAISRSRRTAFISAVLGFIAYDIIHLIESLTKYREATVNIGGAGIFDAVVISGIIATLLAEFIGESFESIQGGHKGPVSAELDRGGNSANDKENE